MIHVWKQTTFAGPGSLQSWRCVKCKATITHSGSTPTGEHKGSKPRFVLADGTVTVLERYDPTPACTVQAVVPRERLLGLAQLRVR